MEIACFFHSPNMIALDLSQFRLAPEAAMCWSSSSCETLLSLSVDTRISVSSAQSATFERQIWVIRDLDANQACFQSRGQWIDGQREQKGAQGQPCPMP